MAGRFFGRAVRRNEDPRLIRGLGTFIDDLRADLTVAFVRSVYAHARFTVDVHPARQRTGVLDVVSAADLEPVPTVPIVIDHPSLRGVPEPLLAVDHVRYVGQPIAAVVAGDPYQAADAVEEVVVDYEPLPVIANVDAALAPDAHLLRLAGRPSHPNGSSG